MTAVEESCAAIADALVDDPVRRTKQRLPLLTNLLAGDDLDASDSLDLDWSWWSLPVNWTDDDGMIGNHRQGQSEVVVRWDWIDLGWMGQLESTAIVPKGLADEETSEDDVRRARWVPRAISVLLLPLPSNYLGRRELDHRGAEEDRRVHRANATTGQRDPWAQPDVPQDDEVVVAYQDDLDAMEEDGRASRAVAELPVGGN